jgi:hypothetical protein
MEVDGVDVHSPCGGRADYSSLMELLDQKPPDCCSGEASFAPGAAASASSAPGAAVSASSGPGAAVFGSSGIAWP